MSAKQNLTDDVAVSPLNITARSVEPTDAEAGDMYLDDGINTSSKAPSWRRYTGSAWEDIARGGTMAILEDQKATTTLGGSTSATTWNNRDLNTEVYDPDNIVAISSNQFTPISGDYLLIARAPAFRTDVHRLRLYNVTGASSVKEGGVARAAAGLTVQTTASLVAQFSADGTDAYRIDHYTGAAKAGDGLGTAVDDGSNEVYLTIELYKRG